MRLISTLTIFALCLASLLARAAEMGSETKTTLIIQPDGSCLVRSESGMPRAMAQQSAVMMERYSEESNDESSGEPAAEPAESEEPAEPKPISDEALTQKLRKLHDAMWNWMPEESRPRVERIDVTKDRVVTIATNAFATIQSLLDDGRRQLALTGLAFERARFEKDGDGRLKLTLSRATSPQARPRDFLQSWKESRFKGELRFVLPGKIVSSDLPATEGNATWVAVDFANEESLQNALKFMTSTQSVVIAELGGLKLDSPIESTDPRVDRNSAPETDATHPNQDASPGFVAEVQSLTLTTLHTFTAAVGTAAQDPAADEGQAGPHPVTVSVRILPPRGKTIQSAQGAKVLRAVDDQGREIRPLTTKNTRNTDLQSMGGYNYGGGPQGTTQIELPLELPLPDARSIESLSAEVVLTTVSEWREVRIDHLKAGSTNVIDLQAILPGATLTITKVTGRPGQFMIASTLAGTAGVRKVQFAGLSAGEDGSSFRAYDSQVTTKAGQTIRKVTINIYGGGSATADAEGDGFRVRIPSDLRQERFQFTLKELDLL